MLLTGHWLPFCCACVQVTQHLGLPPELVADIDSASWKESTAGHKHGRDATDETGVAAGSRSQVCVAVSPPFVELVCWTLCQRAPSCRVLQPSSLGVVVALPPPTRLMLNACCRPVAQVYDQEMQQQLKKLAVPARLSMVSAIAVLVTLPLLMWAAEVTPSSSCATRLV